MSSKREPWIDIAKGLGIILVVISHSGNELLEHYLFWFHMPLFFILSGYTFKTINNKNDFLKWTKKRALQLLIPYFSFGILIMVFTNLKPFFEGTFGFASFFKEFLKLIYGGQMATGAWLSFLLSHGQT